MRGKYIIALGLIGLFLLPNLSFASNSIKSIPAHYFGLESNENVRLLNAHTDELGMKHYKFNQQYNGVPVFGAQSVVHVNKDGVFKSISGEMVEDININTQPTLSENKAIEAAAIIWQEEFNNAEYIEKSTKLYIYDNQLVYQVELFLLEPPLHEYYFIDAHSGELVHQLTGMRKVVDRDIYDCSPDFVDCYLDLSYAGYIYGRSEGQAVRGANPNAWIVNDYDTDTLYNYIGSLYTYYYDKFNRNGANDSGGMGDGSTFATTATTGVTYIDWHPSLYSYCPNAFFNSADSMYFCDGYVTSDIVGHEYAHAVNYFAIPDAYGADYGLTYEDESGALNESNSDVFGEAFEYYYEGSNNWEIGEDLDGGPYRSMSSPGDYSYTGDDYTAVPYPDRFNSENYYCGTGDYGGVHYNNAVPNHAAYLMAMGGTFNGCTIDGIGRDKEEAIFYRAQTVYYTTSTDFNGAYTALLLACNDLYEDADCLEAEKALRAVEMNQAGACSGEPAVDPGCDNFNIAPTISSVSSNTSGYANAGDLIDIDITFSENVTSTGEVLVTLNTGASCSFTVSNATTASCDYTVTAGQNISSLNVSSISGVIIDQYENTMIDFVPTTNLADNIDLVIDTTKPTAPKKLKIYTNKKKTKKLKTINPRKYSKIIRLNNPTPYFVWTKTGDALSGDSRYYVKFTNKKISRSKLLNYKNKLSRKNHYKKGNVLKPNKKYKLYMIVVDRAGNKSKQKTLLTYKLK